MTVPKKVVTYNRIIWAIMSFKAFKTPVMDGIYPVLLQKGIKLFVFILRIFRACISYGCIPTA